MAQQAHQKTGDVHQIANDAAPAPYCCESSAAVSPNATST